MTETFHERYGTLLSVSLPAPGLDPQELIVQSAGQGRFFWHDGRDDIVFAAAGAAVELFAWGRGRYQDIERQARDLFEGAIIDEHTPPAAAPRLFGGFAFNDTFTPDLAWATFHPAHFVLPHYQLVETDGGVWLTLNAHVADDDRPADLIPALREALQEKYAQLLKGASLENVTLNGTLAAPAEVDISYPLDYPAWRAMIDEATGRMRAGELDKVVLARVAEIRSADPIDIPAVLDRLGERFPHCYRFLFEPRPHHAFFGATPELLVETSARHLETMALAGSATRGVTPAADRASAAALLASPKNRHEHDVVVQSLRRRLAPLTSDLIIPDEPEIMTLSNIHHLHTPVTGTLNRPVGVLPLVELLHPTPALGGSPRDKALPLLADLEPVTRGWYAAPIGWLGANLDGVFSVGIRSAVAQDDRVWAYAGAGIVADSEPEQEWEETGVKFGAVLKALRSAIG